jgi:hypothetical protein
MGGTEGTHDSGDVLVLGIDGEVEAAHVDGGEFAGEIGEGGAELRKLLEGGLANDGDGVVGREIVAVIFECEKAEGVDKAVGGVSGDDVDLMINESAVDEAEVHDFGSFGEAKIVAVAPAAEAVGALKKLVADANAPFGRERCDVGDFLEMEFLSVVAANDHGKGVFETEGLGDFEVETVGIELLDALINGVRIALRGFIQDSGKGSAGVFDVEIELAGFEGFVDEERAAEVGFALDGDAGFGFDVLCEEFGEDDLFGEKLGADGDFGWRRLVASGEEVEKVKEVEEVKETELCAAHVKWNGSWEKKEFNTEAAENTENTQKRGGRVRASEPG